MNDEIATEATFHIEDPPARVWDALVAARELAAAHDGGPTWWLPGFRSTAVEITVDPTRELVVTKADEPCAGTRVVVRLEHEGSGSRITVVQSGFDPAFVEHAGEQFWLHAERIFADLEAWFRTGVAVERAWRWPAADLGLSARTAPGGVAVTGVRPGCWAHRVDLTADDLLVVVAGASIYDLGELDAVTQTLTVGQVVAATWVHGDRVCEGIATII